MNVWVDLINSLSFLPDFVSDPASYYLTTNLYSVSVLNASRSATLNLWLFLRSRIFQTRHFVLCSETASCTCFPSQAGHLRHQAYCGTTWTKVHTGRSREIDSHRLLPHQLRERGSHLRREPQTSPRSSGLPYSPIEQVHNEFIVYSSLPRLESVGVRKSSILFRLKLN